MRAFDPLRDIVGAERLAGADGQWPNFHDARIHSLKLWRGDVRPNENVWIGPVIEAAIETTAMERNIRCALTFRDCDAIELSGFDHGGDILDLTFRFEDRGVLRDGATPMQPYICVEFAAAGFGLSLRFRCFEIEVTSQEASEARGG